MIKRLLILFVANYLFQQQLQAQLTPFAAAQGFNVFTRDGFTFSDGHTDGPVAIGGNLTLQGFNIIAMSSYGSYPFGLNNTNNYCLVINGKVNYVSGNLSNVNRGYLRLGNSTGTRVFTQDCNNATINTKLAAYNSDCNTSYNSNPALQMAIQQSAASISSSNALNFDSLYNVLFMNSVIMSGYTASNSCGGSFNIIPVPSNNATITLVNSKTNVINLTTTQLTSLSNLTINNGPDATKPLVINVNGTAGFTWSPPNIAGLGSSQAPYITYNFFNNSGTILISGGNTIEGSLLAPLGYINKSTSQNVEGQIVCYGFTNNGGEVHHFPFNPNVSTLPKCPVLSLGNLVWNDLNGNGIKDANEPGIVGATVKFYADANGDNVPDGAAIYTTVSGTDGSYYFHTLTAGKYIVGVTIPSGYTTTATTTNSSNPDSDTDNDNNAVTVSSGEVRTNYITLGFGSEPTNNGDGLNVNNTLDIGLKGTGSIGNYVWNDFNHNGLQDANESVISNATVTLTFPNGTTTSTTATNSSGAYLFSNLGPGTYTVTFAAPAGKSVTLANQGTDDNIDSDIAADGTVSVTLTAGQTNSTIDAGFYKTPCTNMGSCGAGYVSKAMVGSVTNGDFSSAITSPSSGNSFSGTNATAGITYSYTGGSFISQSEYKGNGSGPQPTSNRSFVIVNNSGTYSQGQAEQVAFPGDPTYNVAAANTYMYRNGNDLGGESLVWQHTLTGLTVGQTYKFRFYATNMVNTGNGAPAPNIRIRTGGTTGLPDGTSVVGPTSLDYLATANNTVLNGWQRMEYSFIASATTLVVKITDAQTSGNSGMGSGDDLGITAIGVDWCARDLDGDCVADVDDKDDDNDGILDVVECGGYDPLGDCDGDGILNYLDPTPGCTTPAGNDIYGKPYVALTWTDCNSDGINDFFDFDGDGIINSFDLDSDNDGIPDIVETRSANAIDRDGDGMADGVDADGDGIMSSADSNDNSYGGTGLTPQDLDRDGKPNYLDLDSDGDGITDLTEAIGIYDSDGIANGTDADGDGMRGAYTNSSSVADNLNGFGGRGIVPIDSDGDGKPDAYDIDSDNDGISDNIEAQATCSYKLPLGTDTDGDGVDNNFDSPNNSCNKTSGGLTPYDRDADGIPDYLDTNSDGDLAPDINEASGLSGNFVTNTADTDGDGMIDEFDTFNLLTAVSGFTNNVTNINMGTNGSFTGPSPSGSNVTLQKTGTGDCATDDRDWRNTSVLPLSIINFSASFYSSILNLQWKTTREFDVDHYSMELSFDGTNFMSSGIVAARNSGNTTYQQSISLQQTADIFFVRIKQVNKNGQFFYTKVISIRINSIQSVTISPNPFSSYLQVNIKAERPGNAILTIYSAEGKKVYTNNFAIVRGSNQLPISNMGHLSDGLYFIDVDLGYSSEHVKLIKTN